MIYNPQNPLDVENAKIRFNKLITGKQPFELTGKKPLRSLDQNAYLHVALSYFASQAGERADWVKKNYYKKLVNPDIFIYERDDRFLGKVKDLRSSAELDTREMSVSIDRFRTWAAQEAGIYIPSRQEEELLQLARIEIERNKEFI